MPGILLTFIVFFIAVISAWFNRRLGIIVFSLFLIVMAVVFLHHATDHLNLNL
ncbi:DUF5993 family protein [Facilibium subflavum]|uniref:DUF5993 family protein n=1 Tax=Facilibium subflavum TaxID=2219058 RepID=UPI0013C2C2D9|nr:DUF5993 family protein [Facilibium subflavum]